MLAPAIIALAAVAFTGVSAGTYSPDGRWGQKAVYVNNAQAVYYVGGQIKASGTQITNEVLVLPLNTTNPAFEKGPSGGLPPTAFGTLAVHETSTSSQLIHVGGLTSSCGSDAIVHTMDITPSQGQVEWDSYNPTDLLRRRGAGGFATNATSGDAEMVIVGGLIDDYVCSSATYAYPAIDTLSLPITKQSSASTSGISSAAFGSTSVPVVDFSIAVHPDGSVAYMAGGADAGGKNVGFGSVAKWEKRTGKWTEVKTKGDVPEGRLGHNMVVHPTLNILIMHGGVVASNSTGKSVATALLSILDLSTLTWSSPSYIQPPASAARAWHSTVMTPQGVLISAFGLDASQNARNDVVYLDMRNTDQTKWSWKSQWSDSMLTAASNSAADITASTAASTDPSTDKSGLLKKILIPTLIVLFLSSPILIYLARRHVRNIRRRRMAQHFELQSEQQGRQTISFRNALDQFRGKGRPDGATGGNSTGLVSSLMALLRSTTMASEEPPKHHSREMMEINANTAHAIVGPRVQWEEIDFGLGRVDEARRESFPAEPSASGPKALSPMPLRSSVAQAKANEVESTRRVNFLDAASSDEGTEQSYDAPLVQVQPATPLDEPPAAALSVLEYPVLRPSMSAPRPSNSIPTESPFDDPPLANVPIARTDDPDWTNFARDLAANPLFSGPPSRLSQQTVPAPTVPAASMVLPPLEFQRRPTSGFHHDLATTSNRRASSGYVAGAPQTRTVSSPAAGRDLLAVSRRVSSSSTASSGHTALVPSPLAEVEDRYKDSHSAALPQRLSNPPPSSRPSSRLSLIPQSGSPSRRYSTRSVSDVDPSGRESRLRVVNVTPNPGDNWKSGQAL